MLSYMIMNDSFNAPITLCFYFSAPFAPSSSRSTERSAPFPLRFIQGLLLIHGGLTKFFSEIQVTSRVHESCYTIDQNSKLTSKLTSLLLLLVFELIKLSLLKAKMD